MWQGRASVILGGHGYGWVVVAWLALALVIAGTIYGVVGVNALLQHR